MRVARIRLVVTAGLLLVAAAGVVIALSDDGSPELPPAERVASFAAPPTPATVPDAATREQFVRAFSHPGLHDGRPMVESLDLRHLRRFSLGDPTRFSIVAARSKAGGICFLGSAGAGGCIDSFHDGAGMSVGYRKIGVTKHNVISGFVPDGVAEVSFAMSGGRFTTRVHDNVFRFVVPDQGGVVRSYTLVGDNGSKRVEPFGTLGPQSLLIPQG